MKTYRCNRHGELNLENAYQGSEKDHFRLRCKICAHEKRVKRYSNTREKSILDAAKWKKENRKRVIELAALDRLNYPKKYEKWRKDYYERNRQAITTRSICRRIGIEVNDYNALMDAQNNKCAICEKEETRKLKGTLMRLCLDHNHVTGKIRALLCHDCNSGLGKFYDSPDLLTKAAIYLMDHE